MFSSRFKEGLLITINLLHFDLIQEQHGSSSVRRKGHKFNLQIGFATDFLATGFALDFALDFVLAAVLLLVLAFALAFVFAFVAVFFRLAGARF